MHGAYNIKVLRLKTRGEVVDLGTGLHAGRSRVRFFIGIILSAAL